MFGSIPGSYQADKLTGQMQSLQALLLPHLKAEEETVTRELLAAHFSEREVRDMHARIDKMAMRNDPTLDLALIWFSIGREERQRTFLDAGKMPFVSHNSRGSPAVRCCYCRHSDRTSCLHSFDLCLGFVVH